MKWKAYIISIDIADSYFIAGSNGKEVSGPFKR